MQRYLLFPMLLASLFFPGMAAALTVEGNYYPLSDEFEYLQDPDGTLTIEELLRQPSLYPFTSSRDSKPRGSLKPVWLKLELDFSEDARARRYLLYARVGNLYDLRLYRPDGAAGYGEWVTGENYPAASRELDSVRYGFAIEPAAEPVTLFIRFIGGPGTGNLPWDLVEEQSYLKNSQAYYSFDVGALSVIGAFLVFNLVIALSLRRKDYLYYSAYIFSVMMGLLTLDGFGFYYLWPDTPALNERALHSFNLLSAGLRLLAVLSFLDIARLAPRLNLASMWVLGLLAVTLLAVNAVGVPNLPPYAPTLPWAIGILCGFVVCGYAIKLRIKLALPLFITLLLPSVSAALQAMLTISGQEVGIIELQMAKLGFAVHVILFSLCLAAHIKIETESHKVALHDSLTGLPGKSLLQERFDWAANLSNRRNWKMAVLFVDLDGFKAVNDTLGHAAGDQLLVQVAARMQGALRRTDFVARLGGDEFVVLLLELEREEEVAPVADKLLAALAAPYHIGNDEARISASIGISLFPGEGEDLQTLLSGADSAMYLAKRSGKNAHAFAAAATATV